jgi:hypothetical protein
MYQQIPPLTRHPRLTCDLSPLLVVVVVVIRVTITLLFEGQARVAEEARSLAFHEVEGIDSHSAALQIARLVHRDENLDTTSIPDQTTAI